MERLTNDQWGFESNCFVCEARNDAGLQIPFFLDGDRGVVTAEFCLGERFSGAPTYLHGGVVLAILDEAMAWATITIGHRWAVTGETTTRFTEPVMVDTTYRVEASLAEGPEPPAESATTMAATGQVIDDRGQVCATATATFVILGEAQALEAVGAAPSDAAPLDESYIRR